MGRHVKEDLSHLVRRLIKQKKLSLREVQERSGGQIEKSYISRIMTGNVKNITLEKLIALARGLDVDPHELFTAYCGHLPNGVNEPQEIFEVDVAEFISLMQKVSVSSELTEIMKEAAQLEPEESVGALRYIMYMNERKRRSKRKSRNSTRDKPNG
jgi:transcriptional regulator with XRE-family HTH domain